jgi:hypothetical protein
MPIDAIEFFFRTPLSLLALLIAGCALVLSPAAAGDLLSIIYGGASGAMQSFFRRGMQQDQMLKIIAYVRTLDK